MARIPLINPQLINAIDPQAERTASPILKAEVVSSEALKTAEKHNALANSNTTDNKSSDKTQATTSSAQEQQYKVVLKIGGKLLETLSTEHLIKGRQLEVKVTPGPELKIISGLPAHNSRTQDLNNFNPPIQPSAQAALQQLLADRIPNIQSQGLNRLIEQLGQLLAGAKIPAKSETASTPNHKLTPAEASLNQPLGKQASSKQALANLTYQSLANDLANNLAHHQPKNNTANIPQPLGPIQQEPLQQVKNWLQQLPSSGDISNSSGLRNALNNTGVRAEAQLSALAQQFITLSNAPQKAVSEQGANTIFQQLQSVQHTIFSASSEPLAKIDLSSIVKNTAQSIESQSQQIFLSLKKSLFNNKSATATTDNKILTAAPAIPATPGLINSGLINSSSTNPSTATLSATDWQNPLLNSPVYSSLSELMQDPLLQNPSTNNKFALSQIVNSLAETNPSPQIPLNWPDRNGNDAALLRTLQNLLAHIEREQGLQLQQAENNSSHSASPANTQNQQWLPLLIHHQQQLQLIEFFIDKEEKKNAQGEKKNHWFINLHFDLPILGELGIEISMFKNECNTTFWSESSTTLNQLSKHIQPLRQRLTEQGIMVSDLQSRHGTLTKRKHNIQQRLIDIKT